MNINGQPQQIGRMLKTGQTTQYNSLADDGFYQKGLAKSFSLLTAGQFAGSVNINLIHYTAATLSFVSATKTIADSANGLAIFKTGDIIVITGSVSNNGTYTVATGNVAGAIVVVEALVNESAGASVSLAKRESHVNSCVLDNNTGLLWSQVVANKMGAASDGKLPHYDASVPYNIFAYAVAANAAVMAGFADWRVPNMFELLLLYSYGVNPPRPDVNYFSGGGFASTIWTSTTNPALTTAGWVVGFNAAADVTSRVKTDARQVILVRG